MTDSAKVSESASVRAELSTDERIRLGERAEDKCAGCDHPRGVHLEPGSTERYQCGGPESDRPTFCECGGFQEPKATTAP